MIYFLINVFQAAEQTQNYPTEDWERTQCESHDVNHKASNFRRMKTLGGLSLQIKNISMYIASSSLVVYKSDVCKHGEKSGLDTNPSGMRARIRACLPSRFGISSADVGMRIGLCECMCLGYELPLPETILPTATLLVPFPV